MRNLNSEELKQVYGGTDGTCEEKEKQGNNGFAYGRDPDGVGDDGVPGKSGDNNSPNAEEKADDLVR